MSDAETILAVFIIGWLLGVITRPAIVRYLQRKKEAVSNRLKQVSE